MLAVAARRRGSAKEQIHSGPTSRWTRFRRNAGFLPSYPWPTNWKIQPTTNAPTASGHGVIASGDIQRSERDERDQREPHVERQIVDDDKNADDKREVDRAELDQIEQREERPHDQWNADLVADEIASIRMVHRILGEILVYHDHDYFFPRNERSANVKT